MKLSIITINYNNAEGLRKTMESVFVQTCKEFEYIVVDGVSKDGSVEIIREYESIHSLNVHSFNFTWVSEPDTGIYNAMNKGIEIAEGRRVANSFNRSEIVEDKNKGNEDGYVLMLNSGDYLVDEHVIEKILPELDGTDIIQGNTISNINGQMIIEKGYGRSEISFIDVMKNHFLHQASFCKIDLFERYGYFDESYKINGDTVFYAKCLGFGNATFKYIDQNIAYYEGGGISDDPDGKWRELRAEEDKRYMDMFSDRMQLLLTEEDKKINLYNKLHVHKWSWAVTMVVARIINMFHKNE